MGAGRDPSPLPQVVNRDEFRAESEALLGALRKWMAEFESWEEIERCHEHVGPLAAVDLHSVVAEVAALRGELRVSSRGAKASREDLEEAASLFREGREDLRSSVERGLADIVGERDRLREELRETREEPLHRSLEALLDTLEALRRGQEASERAKRSLRWRAKLMPRDLLGGLVDGYRMGLRRIENALSALGVTEVPCTGRNFDPRCMRSVETDERRDLPPGQVVEVVRSGYQQGDRILRVAEVRVVVPPQGDTAPIERSQ